MKQVGSLVVKQKSVWKGDPFVHTVKVAWYNIVK